MAKREEKNTEKSLIESKFRNMQSNISRDRLEKFAEENKRKIWEKWSRAKNSSGKSILIECGGVVEWARAQTIQHGTQNVQVRSYFQCWAQQMLSQNVEQTFRANEGSKK